ncbi:hypothetical protein ACIPZ5_17775 [Pseudomonas sp. NPDC089428]|uniref:hypothetical protein n=1 Tax=Pseudomonas sp. NPDC089428 TaxID=3364467 RepID=UPI00381104A4
MNKPTSLWCWLFGFCLIVLIGCSILAVDAHSTLNEYKMMRAADISMMRREIATATLNQSEQCRALITSDIQQLKQYVDVQIPREVLYNISSINPMIINQTANPAVEVNPTMNNRR